MALSNDSNIKNSINALYSELSVLYKLKILNSNEKAQKKLLIENVLNKKSIYNQDFYWFIELCEIVKNCRKKLYKIFYRY